MSHTPQVEDVLAKVVQLSTADRKKLVKRLIDSLYEDQAFSKDEDWNQMLDRLLVIFHPNDWQTFNVDNPTQWVNERKGITG